MSKIIIDINVFLRFLLNDIPAQRDTFEKLLQKAKKSELTLIVPQIIIFEILFILEKYYHVDKLEIIEKLKAIVSSKYLQIEEREVLLSALGTFSHENISFVDCFLLAKAKKERAELITFDQKLKKL